MSDLKLLAVVCVISGGYVLGVWLFCLVDARKQARRRAAESARNEERRAQERASWRGGV